MSSGWNLRVQTLGALSALCWLTGGAAMAEPGLAGVRLGTHESLTRIVLDVTAVDPHFTYTLSEDGLTLEIKVPARASSPAIPAHHAGLVRDVSAATQGGMADIVISATSPIAVVSTGTLKPSGAYRFYRIYFDVGPSNSTGTAPAPVPHTETTVVERNEPVVMAAAEAAGPEPMEHGHAEGHMESHHREDHEEAEPLLTVKVGGSAERSLKDYTTSYGPTFGLETGLFHDALEVELNTTPLMRDGSSTTWKSGLIVKKPIELTEHVAFELGAGPLWLHRDKPEEDMQTESVGIEGVAELVVWPFARKSLGFYVESGYSYDFGKGHEKAAGGGAGLLLAIP